MVPPWAPFLGGDMLLSYSMTLALPRSCWGWGVDGEGSEKEKSLSRRARLVALAFATMLNLQPLSLGGRLLGLQNGESFSHLTVVAVRFFSRRPF